MHVDSSTHALAAQGVRFKVLAQIFPVLRHEVIAPLSNATLATAMLRQAPEDADAQALRQRTQRLGSELQQMLEDSVDVIRGLDQWLDDNGASLPAATLLSECRKLLFSQLMWSKRRVRWPDAPAPVELPAYAARYLVMAWVLCLLPWLPEDAELELDAADPAVWHARLPAEAGPPATPGLFTPQDIESLATVSGGRLERQARCWSLYLPAPARKASA
ncbi:MAG: hypothetical protein ACN6O8_23395 [Achromobacter sp.]|uniref:hypothetical protein n=1 Tax=Achromobacter sp. TaxID=134375 RepID=UPI003CFCA6AE